MSDYKAIAESKKFIVLDNYAPEWKVAEDQKQSIFQKIAAFVGGNSKAWEGRSE